MLAFLDVVLMWPWGLVRVTKITLALDHLVAEVKWGSCFQEVSEELTGKDLRGGDSFFGGSVEIDLDFFNL